ncbi:MAG: alpha/beta hydrolase fold domain-containing protein [Methylotenera sp.]|nr:alpha/beta hydrolase fold domain-containing protein [Methylotenera sp.]
MNYKPTLEMLHPNNQQSDSSIVDSNINASVIWLHGLGADGYDFAPVIQQLDLANIRFILPHAPSISVSINNGYVMPAWYDLYGLTPGSAEDQVGIRASQNYINSLIKMEMDKGIPTSRIVLAGFSQGGAIALHTALRYPQKLAGILALSTYLPLKSTLDTEAHSANAAIPIFMAHGTYDDVISLETCKISLNLLQNRQFSVSWHEYNMAHSLCLEEIDDIRDFLQQVLQQDLVE